MSDSLVPRRITLADIARRLGVSVATVSLALRNDPQISKTRRADIVRVAAEMGYLPDPMLSALNRYRHGAATNARPMGAALAWINRWRRPEALRAFHEFDEYWQGAREMAAARGYRLEEIVWGEKISGQRLKSILRARGIRGVLIPPAERHEISDTVLSWQGFPWADFAAVRLGRSIATAPSFPVVGSDQVYNCRLAFEELHRRGYRRIGLVTSARMTAFTLTMAGFLMAQASLAVKLRIPPLSLAANRGAAGSSLFESWWRENRPDAILTDEKPVRGWLKDLRVQTPQDVALVALSILDGDAASGIDQHSREIGRTAVEVLISFLDRHLQGVPVIGREMLIQGRWIEGGAPTVQKLPTDTL